MNKSISTIAVILAIVAFAAFASTFGNSKIDVFVGGIAAIVVAWVFFKNITSIFGISVLISIAVSAAALYYTAIYGSFMNPVAIYIACGFWIATVTKIIPNTILMICFVAAKLASGRKFKKV
ncbi:TPA: hypothetical protein L4G10_006752 [Pseudomonas aeruginosa]|nr:hypothetical protein [Pseudomonas aeruginosa]HBO1888601.1 hypothetical protein [Pseudomonas aeruginosa]